MTEHQLSELFHKVPALTVVPCRERRSYKEQVESLNKQVSEDKQQQDGLKSRVGDLEQRLHDAGLYLLDEAAMQLLRRHSDK